VRRCFFGRFSEDFDFTSAGRGIDSIVLEMHAACAIQPQEAERRIARSVHEAPMQQGFSFNRTGSNCKMMRVALRVTLIRNSP